MPNESFCVYMHKLRSDGRVYIGQTYNVHQRWYAQGKKYRRCTHFWNAIQKYGWDSFEHIILEDNLSKEEADYYEDYYIAIYDSMNPEHGFNLRYGGSHGKLSEETKKLLSKINKGRKLPEEAIQKMSEKRKGVKLSDYHKQRISEGRKQSQRAKDASLKNVEDCKKKVVCVETNVVFNSVNEAAESVNVSKTCISECLHGKQHTSGGYHWKLFDERGDKYA